jgi:hypothetical protein
VARSPTSHWGAGAGAGLVGVVGSPVVVGEPERGGTGRELVVSALASVDGLVVPVADGDPASREPHPVASASSAAQHSVR